MSSYAVSENTVVPENQSMVLRSEDKTLEETVTTLKEKYNSLSNSAESDNNLPVVYRSKTDIVSAGQLLAPKFPMAFTGENYKKALSELHYVLIGIGSFLFLVYLGWAAVLHANFTQGGDFVYNTGLVGGILMLVALIYALFKRITWLRRSLSSETWYYVHIGFGAVGSYLVILHSSFDLSSINSTVAFMTMIFVIVSGALGRYLFTLFTILMHKQYAEIRDMEPGLFTMIDKYECNTADQIRKRLSKFTLHCFHQPKDILSYLPRWLSVAYYGIYFYILSARDLNRIIESITTLTDLNEQDARELKKSQLSELRQYLFHIVKMGYTNLMEQLLKNWRVLHIPSLYLLAITAVVHVVVVHMY